MVNHENGGSHLSFDQSDRDGFYYKEHKLPVAAWWNMDDFLLHYLAIGIEKLLNGVSLWSDEDRTRLEKARDLAREYIDVTDYSERNWEAGNEALRLIAEVGVGKLWD